MESQLEDTSLTFIATSNASLKLREPRLSISFSAGFAAACPEVCLEFVTGSRASAAGLRAGKKRKVSSVWLRAVKSMSIRGLSALASEACSIS